MINVDGLADIQPKLSKHEFTSAHTVAGLPIPKAKRVELFSPDEWESFVEEWASSLKSKYSHVKKLSGAGDKGIDVVGFLKGATFSGGWHNFQCKHYSHALRPSDVWVEIAKMIYYSHQGDYWGAARIDETLG